MKKAVVLLGITLLLIVISQLIRPVIFKASSKDINGVVISVYSNAKQNVFLRLSNCDRKFQLRSSHLKKFSLADVKSVLLGKRVAISYLDKKLALDQNVESEITKISIDKQVLYSELAE